MGVLVCGLLLILGSTGSQAKTVPPAVKVLSIPAPAFEMPNDSLGYINNGRVWLTEKGDYIRAPLILPNGSVITKVELVGKDAHAASARCAAQRRWTAKRGVWIIRPARAAPPRRLSASDKKGELSIEFGRADPTGAIAGRERREG
jgi:hypothetical protein